MLNILICDVNIKKNGHYITYNQYLLDNFSRIEESNKNVRINFLFNKEAEELLLLDASVQDRVTFLQYSFPIGNSFLYRDKLTGKINAFIKKKKIDEMIFMDLDKFQLNFFIRRLKCKVNGILFRPHHRIKKTSSGTNGLKRYKKLLAEKLLIHNPVIQKIFVLNDADGVNMLNSVHQTTKFSFLTDPIFLLNKREAALQTEPATHAFKFLVFGSLDYRKNIENIIEAYRIAEFSFKTELLLVGGIDQAISHDIHTCIDQFSNHNHPMKKVILEDRFVTDSEMDEYFSQIDVCMLVYKDFYGSSGLLGRAALHQKKVIGSNVGLLNKLIKEYRLGITCNPNNSEDIAFAMQEIKSYQLHPPSFQKFCNQHSSESFLRTLLHYPTPQENWSK